MVNSNMMFAKVNEADVTEAILEGFYNTLKRHLRSDVIVVGAGPAGLTAAWRLAEAGARVLLVEQNNYLGGGLWLGGYFMNPVTIRAPAERILDELGVPYETVKQGLFSTKGPLLAAKLVARALEAGAEVLNLTMLDDVIVEDGKVSGVVVNWSPVQALPRQITCVDPVGLRAEYVVDATGHDAVVARKLAERGLVNASRLGPMWVERSEDLVVEKTGEVYPGLVIAGIAVAEVYGLPRMGPTFGAMLLSGEKAALIIGEKLGLKVKVAAAPAL
ncbi:ribulose-1,5-biphosphate synthetase [Aeropyrum camini SY1 = JCM 12091]|uniref:Thiamine thiazole synthase n=2 Tax=Aeropyrum camini TaxID=229980 RepID=U3TFP9_9CREN|nr:ribulose-1,5-biphosphate synthetase [Aeropyrum camini SY1 = JCM 12091]